MIRIVAGADLETLEVDMDLDKDEVEVEVRNLGILMAEMIKEVGRAHFFRERARHVIVGRAHGVLTMVEGHLGDLVVKTVN